MFALSFGGDWEIGLILAVTLILFAARKLPGFGRGFREGVFQFRKEVFGLMKDLDQGAHHAGESLGGIYGKPAAQALTPDNQTAELYDPAVFQNHNRTSHPKIRGWSKRWDRVWRFIRHFVFKHRTPKRVERKGVTH